VKENDEIYDLSYLQSYITKSIGCDVGRGNRELLGICHLNKRPPLYVVSIQQDLTRKSLCKTRMVKDVNALSPSSGLSFQGYVSLLR